MTIKRTKRTELDIPRLPLVALIDVVLFLLIYFIMVGNLAPVEQNLETALRTDRKASGDSSNLVPQIVSVDAAAGKATYQIGERVIADKGTLASVLGGLNKDAGVVVRVSGRAPVWAAAAAVQACKDAGFLKVSYVPSGT